MTETIPRCGCGGCSLCKLRTTTNRRKDIIRELLRMEELEFGDHSLLPEDHPVARAEKEIYGN